MWALYRVPYSSIFNIYRLEYLFIQIKKLQNKDYFIWQDNQNNDFGCYDERHLSENLSKLNTK